MKSNRMHFRKEVKRLLHWLKWIGFWAGLETAQIEIKWNSDIDSESKEVVAAIAEVDRILAAEELIGHPISIRTIIAALPGDGDVADRISMADLLPVRLKRTFYDPDVNLAMVNFRVRDLGIATYGPVFERIEKQIAQFMERNPGFSMSLEGDAVWRWRNLFQIVCRFGCQPRDCLDHYLYRIGVCLSLPPNRFDFHHSKHFSVDGCRRLFGGDRAKVGDCHGLRIYSVPGNCRR